ncbi:MULTISPECIES: 50S ribosomal protein L24 [Beduini]|uniref:50S ribosomal protein L24 n=1 Tax=Beduini TaxID=1922299 RepID=UPI00059A7DCF|nr:50S ribosomal protein L24 [Beduini massiliensis]
MKIRVGDKVEVIAGKDKGKQGEVLQTLPKENRVVVEGVNMVTKHIKPSQQDPEGGIISREAPIHVSNVAYYDEKAKSITKIGFERVDGRKIRIAKKSGKQIDKSKKK